MSIFNQRSQELEQ